LVVAMQFGFAWSQAARPSKSTAPLQRTGMNEREQERF
jgi:hypothetical protein